MNNSKPTSSAETTGWLSDSALVALALMWGTSHVITKEILDYLRVESRFRLNENTNSYDFASLKIDQMEEITSFE